MRRLLALAVAMVVVVRIGLVAADSPGAYTNAVSWPVADALADPAGLLRHTAHGRGVLASTRPLPPTVHLDVDLRIGVPAGAAGVALGPVTVRVDRAAEALVTNTPTSNEPRCRPVSVTTHGIHSPSGSSTAP